MSVSGVLFFIVLLAISPRVLGEQVYIAVASNFSQTMQLLAAEFEKNASHDLVLSYGSSGKFYAQIKHGAPYDLFFSADVLKPQALDSEGYIVSGGRFTYALGRLALLSMYEDVTTPLNEKLIANNFNKLALANPKFAPYGVAAIDVLKSLNLLDASKPKWVVAENVAQAYQFIDSKNVELGFVAWSQVMHRQKLATQFWLVPEYWHKPIKQDVVWLKRAQNNMGAKAFWDFVRSTKGRNIILENGYFVAEEAQL